MGAHTFNNIDGIDDDSLPTIDGLFDSLNQNDVSSDPLLDVSQSKYRDDKHDTESPHKPHDRVFGIFKKNAIDKKYYITFTVFFVLVLMLLGVIVVQQSQISAALSKRPQQQVASAPEPAVESHPTRPKETEYTPIIVKATEPMVVYYDKTPIFKELLANTKKDPILLSQVDVTKNFQDILYGPGYAAYLWGEPVVVPSHQKQFPPLLPTPVVQTDADGYIELPLFQKLRKLMEHERRLPANVPTMQQSGVQWTQNLGFPRYPFPYRRGHLVQFNSNVVPLPFNKAGYRYLSVLRTMAPDPIDNNQHSTEATCFGDYFPANKVSHLSEHELPTRPSDDEYASWFGYFSAEDMPWIPQLPPYPMIPENEFVAKEKIVSEPQVGLTTKQQANLRKVEVPALGHTAEYRLYSRLVPWVFTCLTPVHMSRDNAMNVYPDEQLKQRRRRKDNLYDTEDARTFVTSCGTIGMNYGSAQSQFDDIDNEWGQSFLDVAVLDARLDTLFTPLDECKGSRMRPIPHFAWEGRVGTMTNRIEKNWDVLAFGFGSIFNLNMYMHLQTILQPHHVDTYFDPKLNLITLSPAQREELHVKLLNEFDISRPIAIYRGSDPLRISYGPYDIQGRPQVLGECWTKNFQWPHQFDFDGDIHNGPQPQLIAIPPHDKDHSLDNKDKTQYVYASVAHTLGRYRITHYITFMVFLDPQTLEFLGATALNFPLDANTRDLKICSTKCGRISSRLFYKHSMWINEPPLSFKTQGDQRPPTLLPTVASLDSEVFISASWNDLHMGIVQVNLRELWELRAPCPDIKPEFTVQWTDVPNHGPATPEIELNREPALPMEYAGVTHGWGSNFRQWWHDHHSFELDQRLADVIDIVDPATAATTTAAASAAATPQSSPKMTPSSQTKHSTPIALRRAPASASTPTTNQETTPPPHDPSQQPVNNINVASISEETPKTQTKTQTPQ